MTASFSRPGKQPLQPVFGAGAQICLKMKLGNPSQAQSAGQLMAQVVLGVVQGGEGIALDFFVTSNSNYYMGMASIWGHSYGIYLN
jgi:hypothetical protein